MIKSLLPLLFITIFNHTVLASSTVTVRKNNTACLKGCDEKFAFALNGKIPAQEVLCYQKCIAQCAQKNKEKAPKETYNTEQKLKTLHKQ